LLLTRRFREEDSVPLRQAWSANGSLEDQELMAQREVLKRDGRRNRSRECAGRSRDRSRESWGLPA